MQELIKTLKTNLCVVSYKKINTDELREMECTLNPELIPNYIDINQSALSDHVVVWATDRNAWRSFRVSTMVNWQIIS